MYQQWRSDYHTAAGVDPALQAQLWNLENEHRVPKVRGSFKRKLGRLHTLQLGTGASPADAAKESLQQGIRETKPVGNKWLGRLSSTAGNLLPHTLATHLSSGMVAKNRPEVYIDPKAPPRRVVLNPIKSTIRGGARVSDGRFIWTTWATTGSHLPDDAAAVKRELGLAHYPTGEHVYRCEIDFDHARHMVFVPTCFDAGLGPAWKPPPRGFTHSWGLTRDLTTGDFRWPELLVETADHLGTTPVGHLVGNPPAPIGHVAVDYMIGR